MKHRKEFLLDESTIAYLDKYKDEKHCQSLTAALTGIVNEHRHRNNIDTTAVVIQQIAEKVTDLLSDKLTRLRLGVNNADRNSDIIIMLINSLIAYQKFTSLVTDDTPQLAKAKEIEKARIANFRQRKLERSKEKADKKISPKQQEDDNTIENIVDDDLIV